MFKWNFMISSFKAFQKSLFLKNPDRDYWDWVLEIPVLGLR